MLTYLCMLRFFVDFSFNLDPLLTFSCSQIFSWDSLARSERLELPTAWFEARNSIQLSYERLTMNNIRVNNARPERFELPTPKFVAWCSIQLSYGRKLTLRRERDSNPRWSFRPHTPLAGERLQPLGHLSKESHHTIPGNRIKEKKTPGSFCLPGFNVMYETIFLRRRACYSFLLR